MKKAIALLGLCIAALAAVVSPAAAQAPELELLMSKSSGFSLGNQIQGQFNLAVSGPSDITSVTYLIDGGEMATVTPAPFRYSFSTDKYSFGQHQFSATARTASGAALKSNVIDVEIISAAAGFQATGRTVLPILGLVLLLVLAIIGLQVIPFGSRRRYEPGEARSYGISGGAICVRCGRPFPRSTLALNLLTSKLERCPYCGKWQTTRAASAEALAAAEKAEIQAATPSVRELTPEERLRQQIEESKLSR